MEPVGFPFNNLYFFIHTLKFSRVNSLIPGIFIPVELGGKMILDGGLVENVPISPLKKLGADMIVGVDLNANRKYKKPEDLIDVLANALDLASDNATRIQAENAYILIAPEIGAYNRTDVEKIISHRSFACNLVN